MKVVIHAFFLTLLLSFGAQSIFADGLPPSEEDVCDVLQDDGITGGLFGLCNAFCEAKDCDDYPEGEAPRSCDRILANYNKKRDDSEDSLDPEMPCLVDDSPTCPCWTDEQFADRGLGLDPMGCLVNVPGIGSLVEYSNASGDMITFVSTDTGGCEYDNSFLSPDPVMLPGLTPGQDAACMADVETIVDEVAGDVPDGCVVFP